MRTRLFFASLALVIAVSAVAQSAEFDRASGGELRAITKSPSNLSGSFRLSTGSGLLRGRGYDATVGGKVSDKIYFFGAGSILPQAHFNNAFTTAKTTAQPVDWSSVTASFQQYRQPTLGATTLQPLDGTSFSRSFLSLHSTTMLSDRAAMTFSFSRSNAASDSRLSPLAPLQ